MVVLLGGRNVHSEFAWFPAWIPPSPIELRVSGNNRLSCYDCSVVRNTVNTGYFLP